jgi:hypothetical protein
VRVREKSAGCKNERGKADQPQGSSEKWGSAVKDEAKRIKTANNENFMFWSPRSAACYI